MNVLSLVAVLLVLATAGAAGAKDVAIVKGASLPPFEEAIRGFKRALQTSLAHRGPRRVESVAFNDLTLTGTDPDPDLSGKLKSLDPDLVLAVGSAALDSIRHLGESPVVHVLVPSPPPWVDHRTNLTGVEMTIPAGRWIDIIRSALPDRRRLGLLYDPKRTGDFVSQAEAAAARKGVAVLAVKVRSSREVHDRILELAGRVDAFWMLPDLTVVTPQSVESLGLFSLRNGVPIVTFSEKYLDLGAAVAVVPDFEAMGRQAGEMARRILDGVRIDRVPREEPKAVHVRVNSAVTERLAIAIDSTQLDAP